MSFLRFYADDFSILNQIASIQVMPTIIAMLDRMGKSEKDGKWFRVSLRFSGDNLSLDEIEELLDIEPSSTGKKGEHLRDNPRYAKHNTNIWVWSFTEDRTIPFNQQIGDLLDILEPRKHVFEELLSIPGVEGELFLGFAASNGQGGAYFPPLLLARVSDLGLALSLDLYPYD